MRYLFGKNGTDHSMTRPTGRRRAIVAFFLSGVFPGLGQFYNHQALKGGAFVVAGVALSWLIGRVVPTDLMALASGSVGTTRPMSQLSATPATRNAPPLRGW
jgi:hypothetical protein